MKMKINLYGKTLFTVNERDFSIDNIMQKLKKESGELIFSDKEHTVLKIEHTGIITPIRRISMSKNDIIITLSKKNSPKLCEYFSKNVTKVIDYYNKYDNFVYVTESTLKSLYRKNDFKEEIDKALNSSICPICGRKIDKGLIEDFRGEIVTTKYISCKECACYNDEFHLELRSTSDVKDKYKKIFIDNNVEIFFTK